MNLYFEKICCSAKLQPVAAILSWSHYCVLLRLDNKTKSNIINKGNSKVDDFIKNPNEVICNLGYISPEDIREYAKLTSSHKTL